MNGATFFGISYLNDRFFREYWAIVFKRHFKNTWKFRCKYICIAKNCLQISDIQTFRHSPCNPQRPLQSLNFIAAKINKEVKSAKPDISNDVKCNKRYFAWYNNHVPKHFNHETYYEPLHHNSDGNGNCTEPCACCQDYQDVHRSTTYIAS